MILIINSFDNTAKLYDDFSFRLEKSLRSPRAIKWDQISGVGIIVPHLAGESIVKAEESGGDTNFFAKKILSKIPDKSLPIFYIDGNAIFKTMLFENHSPSFNYPLGLAHQELLRVGLAKSGLILHDSQVITCVLDNQFSLVAWNKGAPIELVVKDLLPDQNLKLILKPKLRNNPKWSFKLSSYLKDLTFGVGGLMLYLGRVDGIFMAGPFAESTNLVREGLLMSLRAFPTTHIITSEVDPVADAARMISRFL